MIPCSRSVRQWLSVVLTRRVFPVLALFALLITQTPPALAANSEVAATATSETGRPFTLVDHNGQTVTDRDFRGRWLLVYFGYTHCPDSCPTALSDMAAALGDLDPAKRDKIRALFISVDPERDTPAVMKDYVEAFDNVNIIGLTGTNEQVGAAEAVYRFRAQRYRGKNGDYIFSHTSAIHIMDPTGQFVTSARPEQIAERLARIVR